MASNLDTVLARAILPGAVRPDGTLTLPRTYGVYVLPPSHGSSRKYRFGNHPVRQRELQLEFGKADLLHLFLSRQDAVVVSDALNRRQA